MRYCIEGEYVDGGLVVQSYEKGEYGWEPWATCSVCLSAYGIIPKEDEIIIPAYKTFGFEDKIINDIAEEVLGEIHFGPFESKGILVRLKKEFLQNKILETSEE